MIVNWDFVNYHLLGMSELARNLLYIKWISCFQECREHGRRAKNSSGGTFGEMKLQPSKSKLMTEYGAVCEKIYELFTQIIY